MTQEEIDALPETLTIPLAKPIVLGDGAITFSELVLNEPTAEQSKQIFLNKPEDQPIFMVSLCSGAPVEVVGRVPTRVLNKAVKYLMGFIEMADEPVKPGPGTGSSS